MYQAIVNQLQAFGLDETEAELVMSVARQNAQRETSWNDETGPRAWRKVQIPVTPETGAPRDLHELRTLARQAGAAGEAGPEARKRALVRLFYTAASAVAQRPQDARVLSFGEGARFDFLFRSSLDGRRTFAFVRPRRNENDASPPSGGVTARYAGQRPAVISRLDVRRVPNLIPA